MKEIIYKIIEFIFWFVLSTIYFYHFHNSGNVMHLVCGLLTFVNSILALVKMAIKMAIKELEREVEE